MPHATAEADGGVLGDRDGARRRLFVGDDDDVGEAAHLDLHGTGLPALGLCRKLPGLQAACSLERLDHRQEHVRRTWPLDVDLEHVHLGERRLAVAQAVGLRAVEPRPWGAHHVQPDAQTCLLVREPLAHERAWGLRLLHLLQPSIARCRLPQGLRVRGLELEVGRRKLRAVGVEGVLVVCAALDLEQIDDVALARPVVGQEHVAPIGLDYALIGRGCGGDDGLDAACAAEGFELAPVARLGLAIDDHLIVRGRAADPGVVRVPGAQVAEVGDQLLAEVVVEDVEPVGVAVPAAVRAIVEHERGIGRPVASAEYGVARPRAHDAPRGGGERLDLGEVEVGVAAEQAVLVAALGRLAAEGPGHQPRVALGWIPEAVGLGAAARVAGAEDRVVGRRQVAVGHALGGAGDEDLLHQRVLEEVELVVAVGGGVARRVAVAAQGLGRHVESPKAHALVGGRCLVPVAIAEEVVPEEADEAVWRLDGPGDDLVVAEHEASQRARAHGERPVVDAAAAWAGLGHQAGELAEAPLLDLHLVLAAVDPAAVGKVVGGGELDEGVGVVELPAAELARLKVAVVLEHTTPVMRHVVRVDLGEAQQHLPDRPGVLDVAGEGVDLAHVAQAGQPANTMVAEPPAQAEDAALGRAVDRGRLALVVGDLLLAADGIGEGLDVLLGVVGVGPCEAAVAALDLLVAHRGPRESPAGAALRTIDHAERREVGDPVGQLVVGAVHPELRRALEPLEHVACPLVLLDVALRALDVGLLVEATGVRHRRGRLGRAVVEGLRGAELDVVVVALRPPLRPTVGEQRDRRRSRRNPRPPDEVRPLPLAASAPRAHEGLRPLAVRRPELQVHGLAGALLAVMPPAHPAVLRIGGFDVRGAQAHGVRRVVVHQLQAVPAAVRLLGREAHRPRVGVWHPALRQRARCVGPLEVLGEQHVLVHLRDCGRRARRLAPHPRSTPAGQCGKGDQPTSVHGASRSTTSHPAAARPRRPPRSPARPRSPQSRASCPRTAPSPPGRRCGGPSPSRRA